MAAGRAIVIGAASALLGCTSLGGAAGRGEGRARVALRCPDGDAEVTVDGVPRGRASDYGGGTGRQLLLIPGVHKLEVRAGSGQRVTRELTVGPEDALTVAIELPPGKSEHWNPLGAAKAYELVRGGSP